MRGAVVHRFLRVVELHEAKLDAGREAVAATYAIEDLEFRILSALEEFAVVPENRAPVVLRRRDHATQRRGGDLEVLELLHRRFDHRLEGVSLDVADVVINAFD